MRRGASRRPHDLPPRADPRAESGGHRAAAACSARTPSYISVSAAAVGGGGWLDAAAAAPPIDSDCRKLEMVTKYASGSNSTMLSCLDGQTWRGSVALAGARRESDGCFLGSEVLDPSSRVRRAAARLHVPSEEELEVASSGTANTAL